MNPYPLEKNVLILDNAAVHDKVRIYALCARFGVVVLFLPTCSFDFNPIELLFHLGKDYIRQHDGIDAAENPLSVVLNKALFSNCSADDACLCSNIVLFTCLPTIKSGLIFSCT